MDRNEYLEIVAAQVRCKRAVPYLKEELEDHIQDQKDAYIADGMNPFEAEMNAVKEMGDPVETGVQLDMVHRPKMEWKVLIGAVLMGLIGLAVQFIIAKGSEPSLGDSGAIGLLGRQLVGMAAGVVIMMVLCYLDYSLLMKWALPIWGVLVIAIVYSTICGVTVNGRSLTAMRLAYFIIPFYAGVIYKFRNEKWKGLLKSLACLGITVLSVLKIPDLGSAITILLSGLLMISAAVYQRWYQVDRKKVLIGLWGSLSAGGLLLLGTVFYKILQGESSYRIERIKAWFGRESGDFILEQMSEVAENVKSGTLMDWTMWEYVRNNYIWTYLMEYLGTWQGILLLAVFIAFMGMLFMGVLKQKNRLGYLTGLACVLYLGIQAFIYIGMNFKMVPFSGNYMPFFSNGIGAMVVTYFYMGILLSIFRNSTVVRN